MGQRTEFLRNLLQPHSPIIVGLFRGLVPGSSRQVFGIVPLNRIDLYSQFPNSFSDLTFIHLASIRMFEDLHGRVNLVFLLSSVQKNANGGCIFIRHSQVGPAIVIEISHGDGGRIGTSGVVG